MGKYGTSTESARAYSKSRLRPSDSVALYA